MLRDVAERASPDARSRTGELSLWPSVAPIVLRSGEQLRTLVAARSRTSSQLDGRRGRDAGDAGRWLGRAGSAELSAFFVYLSVGVRCPQQRTIGVPLASGDSSASSRV